MIACPRCGSDRLELDEGEDATNPAPPPDMRAIYRPDMETGTSKE